MPTTAHPRGRILQCAWQLALLGLVFALILLSHHPTALSHAELWGDDGASWFPDAYRLGVRSLLLPSGGYLDSIQRVVGLLVQFVPFHQVARVFAIAGLLAQIAPPLFMASARMAEIVPRSWLRLFLALLYLSLPNAFEIYVNLTNAQWHLAVLAFLVLVSTPPTSIAGKVFDAAVLLASGLSGPFCLMLTPVALWQLAERRGRTAAWRAATVVASVAVQAVFIVSAGAYAGRQATGLGANAFTLARIIAMQIVLGAQIGYYAMPGVTALPLWRENVLPCLIDAIALSLAILALVRGSALLRKFCLFAALMFGAALLSPSASGTKPQWLAMTEPFVGNRYYTFPMLAWVGILITLACDRIIALRAIGVALLLVLLCWGVPHDWPYIYWYQPRHNFGAEARLFEAAPVGTRMVFPLYPGGEMVLVKQAR